MRRCSASDADLSLVLSELCNVALLRVITFQFKEINIYFVTAKQSLLSWEVKFSVSQLIDNNESTFKTQYLQYSSVLQLKV
jgi:hypothetical protein